MKLNPAEFFTTNLGQAFDKLNVEIETAMLVLKMDFVHVKPTAAELAAVAEGVLKARDELLKQCMDLF